MDVIDFNRKTGLNPNILGGTYATNTDHLPCFAHRWTVNDDVNTPELIEAYVRLASVRDDNDVLVFSVTERDKCWNVWKEYSESHPRKFKVVEGGSIHGFYKCRMYIYTKPIKERKFHPDNIGKYRRR